MKLIFENWNNYLNEETIEESFKLRDYYNIELEDWMAMSGKERKQIRAKYKQEMAQKASQGAQPAGEQESGDPAVIFVRQLAQTPFYKAVAGGLTPQEMINNMSDPEDAVIEISEGLVDSLLDVQAKLAAKFYGEGDSGAGSQYQAITKFIRSDLKNILTHYKLPPVPEINLWKDDFDSSEQRAMRQSVPAKFSNGEDASDKVLSLGDYDKFAGGDAIGVQLGL